MNELTRIAVDRLGLIPAPTGTTTPAVATTILAEFAHAGIRITNPDAVTDNLAVHVRDIVAHLNARRGKRATFSPLFRGFPDQLPSYDIGALRLLSGAVRLASRAAVNGGAITDDDVRAAMDFTTIGWWPASSVPQDVDRARLDRAVQDLLPGDTRIEWLEFTIVTDDELDGRLRAYMRDCFASAASLRDDVHTDLRYLARQYGVDDIDTGTVRFRENRALLFAFAWEKSPGLLTHLEATPDDILRLFAVLTGGDVSLTEPIRFPKLTRAQRRAVVNALEASPRRGDVFRYRGLWLAITAGLHLDEFIAPKTQAVIGRLRDGRHDRESFTSRFEALLPDKYPDAVCLAAAEAPGVLGRSLRRLAYLAGSGANPNRRALVDALVDAAGQLPVRILLAARRQIADNGGTYPRVVFTKSGSARTIDRASGHLAVDARFQAALLDVLDTALRDRFAALGTWSGKCVWIDPALNRVLLPDQLRSTAAGLIQVERGTRLPSGVANVIRMFVHWRENGVRSDLDLSCVAMNEQFRPVDHVSWTRLANSAMTHSGDLTSAPAGAQEFIDINLDAVRAFGAARDWRYLVPTVLRYAGPAFAALAEAEVGWMLRDECNSDRRTFDPVTVVNAFALTGGKRTAVPMLLDLATGELVYIDVYLPGDPGAMVERDAGQIAQIVSAVAGRAATKPSVADLARAHLAARGATPAENARQASVTFGLDDTCTYNALRPEKILADLL